MKKTAFLGYLSFYSIVVSGQTNTEAIKGNVKDEKKQPIEFVNVLLLNAIDSSLVKGSITNKKGDFEIFNFPAGEYRIECSQIGFLKYYSDKFNSSSPLSFDNIILKENSNVLQEVEITNKRPFIELSEHITVNIC
ncbi:MAG: carboxypeptidase-like regulatory domain-containing protein [Bacteroidota bacterium]